MHITEIGAGQYKLTDSWLKQKLGTCDNATRQLNGLSAQLTKALIDAGITSKNLANAQASYNLANFVRDTKRTIDRGDWQQIPGVKLFKKTWSSAGEFGTALGECISKIAKTASDAAVDAMSNIDLSWDNILEHLMYNDNGEVLYVDESGLTVRVDQELGLVSSSTITVTVNNIYLWN